jgi:hypothetical protein
VAVVVVAAIDVVELEVGEVPLVVLVVVFVAAALPEELLHADANSASDAASIAIHRFRITEL